MSQLKQAVRAGLSPDKYTYFKSKFLPSSHCPDLVEHLARFIAEKSLGDDLILLTGDVATTGLVEDQVAAYQFITSQPSRRGSYLSDLRSPTLAQLPIQILPGNHDRYRDYRGKSGNNNFFAQFPNHWPVGELVRTAIIKRGETRLAIIAADFTLLHDSDADIPWYAYRFGQGRAYPRVIRALEKKTTEMRERFDDIGVVWATHFPPCKESVGLFDALKLHDYDHVLEAAEAQQIGLIFSGHVHRRGVHNHGNVKILCAGSATSFALGDGNWVHRCRIDVSNNRTILISYNSFAWDEDQQNFELQPTLSASHI